jgi:DNA recombination protein RmuC
VVVLLPDDKHLIIDSKVSITAYERFVNTDDDLDRSRFLKEHIDSVRSHIKTLGEKAYHTAKGLKTPDFILLFMPLESAFSAAIQNDSELFYHAWEKKIVLVSPTTLLATLRTVSSIWKMENSNRNAAEIARLSGALYDKFTLLLEDLIRVGKSMEQADDSYKEAMKKLAEGKGNAVRIAEKIKELGAKTGPKQIPPALIERAMD